MEHEPGGHAGIGVVVLVAVVDDLGDAGLDDGLGTLVAGEEGDIHPRALEVVVGAVEDGVQLGVADVHIFRVQRLTLPLPRHGVVVAADGHAVVAQREDLVFRADDAGAHLTAGVLGAHGREQGNAHEVFVPVDIIRAFHRKKTSVRRAFFLGGGGAGPGPRLPKAYHKSRLIATKPPPRCPGALFQKNTISGNEICEILILTEIGRAHV